MKDPRFREVVVGQLRHPAPQGVVGLTAPPERAPPEPDDLGPEVAECRVVGRHGVVGEEAPDNLRQPAALFGDGLVPPPSQFLLDLPELRPQPIPPGLPLQQEGAAAADAADEVKPRKSKVSGLPSPRRARPAAARRPNSIRRVLSGWSDKANASNLSRSASRKRRASPSCRKPTPRSSA